jgi:hypothetical protein
VVLAIMGRPAVVTLSRILEQKGLPPQLEEWLHNRSNRRVVPKHLQAAGYVYVHNPGSKEQGLWKVDGRNQAIYGREDISPKDRIAAARRLKETSSNAGGKQ